MKAAVFYGPGDLRVVDTERPQAGSDGVVVKVKAVGICGTDLHTYKLGMFKEMSVPAAGGVLFGHEFAGDVVEVGPDANVQDIEVGNRVVAFGFGAYAEYIRIGPSPLVFNIPDHVTYEEAATLDPLAVAAHGVRRAEPVEDDIVLILGAGMIGLSCIQVLKARYHAKQIIVSDISEVRLNLAKKLGADLVINAGRQDVVKMMLELTGSAPVPFNVKPTAHVDVVLECAGLSATTQQALEVIKPDTGRVSLVALYENTPIKIDLNDAVTKTNDVRGVYGFKREDLLAGLDLLTSGKVDRKPLITHRFPLDEVKKAFETQLATSDCMKVIMHP